MKVNSSLLYLIILLITLVGCTTSLISRYDPETHRNLAYLKPDIKNIYHMYTTTNINYEYLCKINMVFRYILSYERSKGNNNLPTIKQIEIIQKMFNRHIKERLSQGRWTIQYANIKLNNILTAIDVAIQSELSKNKQR